MVQVSEDLAWPDSDVRTVEIIRYERDKLQKVNESSLDPTTRESLHPITIDINLKEETVDEDTPVVQINFEINHHVSNYNCEPPQK